MPDNECQRAMHYLACLIALPTCGPAGSTPANGTAAKPCSTLCETAVTLCGDNVVSLLVPFADCHSATLFSDGPECVPLAMAPANACPLGCNAPHGQCNAQGYCECAHGWYGVDCSSQYCEGTTQVTVPASGAGSVSITSGPAGFNLRGGCNCTWVLTVEGSVAPVNGAVIASSHVTLDWDMFQTGWSHVRVFNGDSLNRHQLLRDFAVDLSFTPAPSAANLIQPVMSITNQMTVQVRPTRAWLWGVRAGVLFDGGGVGARNSQSRGARSWCGAQLLGRYDGAPGFVASAASGCLPTCVAPHGYCDDTGRCVCSPGWYGVGCADTWCSGLTVVQQSDRRNTTLIRDRRLHQPRAFGRFCGRCCTVCSRHAHCVCVPGTGACRPSQPTPRGVTGSSRTASF